MALVRVYNEMINTDWVVSVTKNRNDGNKTDVTMLLPDERFVTILMNESAYSVSCEIERAIRRHQR